MASEYTPTDEQVRDGFVWLSAGDDEAARELAEEDYDRWLSAHDARVRSERDALARRIDAVREVLASEERYVANLDPGACGIGEGWSASVSTDDIRRALDSSRDGGEES